MNETVGAVKNKVIDLLMWMHYDLKHGEQAILEYIAEDRVQAILNATNQTALPDGLFTTAVNDVLSAFLRMKLTEGENALAGVEITPAVVSVTEGDTSIHYDNHAEGTPEGKIMLFCEMLDKKYNLNIIRYRKMRW